MTDLAGTIAATLVGVTEIREILLRAISKNRVEELTFQDDFPSPAAVLAQGEVWLAEEVEAWLDGHGNVVADLFRAPDGGRS